MDDQDTSTVTVTPVDGDGDVNALKMRKALGRFVTGVTIVTTSDIATADGEPGEVHGMTANAFTSVSLRPPLVLISLASTAKIHQLVTRTGRYGVSILAADQEALSLHFAGAAKLGHLVDLMWRDGLPLVRGALVHLTCTVRDSYEAGDHTLHVAEVNRLWYRNGDPLVYYTGTFRALELLIHDGLWGF